MGWVARRFLGGTPISVRQSLPNGVDCDGRLEREVVVARRVADFCAELQRLEMLRGMPCLASPTRGLSAGS